MQICADGICTHRNFEGLRPRFTHERHPNFNCAQLRTATFFRIALFRLSDQAVAAPCPARMTLSREIQWPVMRNALRRDEILVIGSAHLNKGGTTVDHTLRLDVLAVCAVFMFVGAVLLGAF
jgi:hypothetical protein